MEKEITVILGPTASGKTKLAVQVAYALNAEIVSADSRQVYKGMDIGTGKDYDDYLINNLRISCHLIDILNPGEKYNLARFQKDFYEAANDIISRGKKVILCGGTGLYIQSLILNFENTAVPENPDFRKNTDLLSDEEIGYLLSSKGLISDTRKRAVRRLEIEKYLEENGGLMPAKIPDFNYKVFGLNPEIDQRRAKITERLRHRLKDGLIQEVEKLKNDGLSSEMLEYYGLEYRYIDKYLNGDLNAEEMFEKLNTEIHRFAKRQMTFFRSMEKKGVKIRWIDDNLSFKEKVEFVIKNAAKN